MSKHTERSGFQLANARAFRSVRGAAVVRPDKKDDRLADAQPEASSDAFGGFSSEEKAFLDGMAKHREIFSAAAVEARSLAYLKRS